MLLTRSSCMPCRKASGRRWLGLCCQAQSIMIILSSVSLAMTLLACVALLLYSSTNTRLAALLKPQHPASLLDLPSPSFSQATVCKLLCAHVGLFLKVHAQVYTQAVTCATQLSQRMC